jgi:hypothetical protein
VRPARILVVLAYEALMALFVFGPLRHGTWTWGQALGVGLLQIVLGATVPLPWAFAALVPPVAASAALGRPPGQEILPVGLMLLFLPVEAALVAVGRVVRAPFRRPRGDAATR